MLFRTVTLYLVFLVFVLSASASFPAKASHVSIIKKERITSSSKPCTKDCVEIRGNLLFGSKLLFKKMGLSGKPPYSEEKIALGIKRLEEHYKSLGYTLARIEYRRRGSGWLILIDEGVLSNIYISGLGWYDTFMLRNELLPLNIFNETRLKDELKFWTAKTHRKEASFKLVKTKSDDIPLLKLIGDNTVTDVIGEVLRKNARYELYVHFKKPERRKGTHFGLEYRSSEGVGFNIDHFQSSVVSDRDLLRFGGSFGIARHPTVDPAERGHNYYSDVGFNIRWRAPDRTSDRFHIYLDADVEHLNRQRADLPLDRYKEFNTQSSLLLALSMRRDKFLFASAGYELRRLYDFDYVSSSPFTPRIKSVDGPMFTAGLDMKFGSFPKEMGKTDMLRVEYKGRKRGGGFNSRIEMQYRKVFQGNGSDLFLNSFLLAQGGRAEFFDEEDLVKLGMSSSFGRKFYIKNAFNQEFELRLHILRRDVQLAVFTDLAVFGRMNHVDYSQSMELAHAVGPGIYVLFYDAFQLHAEYSFGWATTGDISHDVNLGLRKIF